jgi:hypothetical protein
MAITQLISRETLKLLMFKQPNDIPTNIDSYFDAVIPMVSAYIQTRIGRSLTDAALASDLYLASNVQFMAHQIIALTYAKRGLEVVQSVNKAQGDSYTFESLEIPKSIEKLFPILTTKYAKLI